jgi:hypothetical protein
MCCARNHDKFFVAAQLRERPPIQLQDNFVPTANDQQRRCGDEIQRGASKIAPTTARHNRSDNRRPLGSCHQGGCHSTTRPE